MVIFKFKKNGFSLIETIIVIGIIAILSGISFPIYSSMNIGNNLESVALEIIEALRYSQSNARAVKNDSPWGVKISDNQIIIFNGDSYLNRDPNYDQIYDLSSKIKITGLNEIVFEKISGFVNNAGSFSLSIDEREKNIEINEKGIILH